MYMVRRLSEIHETCKERERTEEMEGGANQREWGERGEVFEWVGREDKSAEELWLIEWTVSE